MRINNIWAYLQYIGNILDMRCVLRSDEDVETDSDQLSGCQLNVFVFTRQILLKIDSPFLLILRTARHWKNMPEG